MTPEHFERLLLKPNALPSRSHLRLGGGNGLYDDGGGSLSCVIRNTSTYIGELSSAYSMRKRQPSNVCEFSFLT